MSTRPGRFHLGLIRLGISACAVLLGAGVLELVALIGLIDYRGVIPTRHVAMTQPLFALELDPELVHKRHPHQRLVGQTSGDQAYWLGLPPVRRYAFDVRYDDHGFRNEQELERAAVVVIGDSFVEASLVPQASLLSTRVSDLLGVEVANLGQSYYGPQQELVVLRRYGLPLQPKVVLWLFYEGNDLFDVQAYERRTQDWSATVRDANNFAARSFVRNALQALAELATPPPQAESDLGRRSSCEVTRSSPPLAERLYFIGSAEVGGYVFDERHTLERTETVLLEAVKLARENGAEFLLAYVPSKFRVYHQFCEFPPDGYARGWTLKEWPAWLARWAALNKVTYLDLTPPLEAAAADGELVFFSDDSHWNARGNEIAAQAVFESIRSRGWFLRTVTPASGR